MWWRVIWLPAIRFLRGHAVDVPGSSECNAEAGRSVGNSMLQVSISRHRQGEVSRNDSEFLEATPNLLNSQSGKAYEIKGFFDHADADLHRRGSIDVIDLARTQSIHSSQGNCLKFLHIPKNAGTTMEELRLEYTKNGGTLNASGEQGGWGRLDHDLTCSNVVGLPERWDPALLGPAIACGISDAAGHRGNCSVWHTPPAFDQKLAESYAEPGCETFCIVRNPLTKLWSHYLYQASTWIDNISYPAPGACSAAAFASYIGHKMSELVTEPFLQDCHFVPQSQYTQHGRFCQHAIRFENLTQEFNALMSEHGIPLTLGTLHAMQSSATCSMEDHLDKIPPHIINWVEEYYKEDYAELSYRNVSLTS